MSESQGADTPGGQKSFVDTIKNNAGLLLVAFIGAANFIGISTGEIPNILRNEEGASNYTAFLIALAITAGVVSAVLKDRNCISVWWYVPAALAVVALFLFAVAGIQISQNRFLYNALLILAIGLAVVTAAMLIASFTLKVKSLHRDDKKASALFRERVSAKLLALLLAIFLTVIATYATLRVETRSQNTSNEPRLTAATIAHTGAPAGDKSSLTATVNASRLPAGNIVEMTVYAYVEADAGPNTAPPSVGPDCLQDESNCGLIPCIDSDDCVVVSETLSEPDPNGNVSSKITAPVPAKAYYLIITGVVHPKKSKCKIDETSNSCLRSTVTINVPPDP
jgi:hypothetical protein